MKYVIHGATGAQGAPLYAKLRGEGAKAVAAVRNTDALQGAPAIAVDLASVDSLAAAYAEADGVFVHLPLGAESVRLEYARNIAKAVGRAKPARVLISTSGWDMSVPDDRSAVPRLVREVEKTGVSTAVIAPVQYLENLLLPIVAEPLRAEHVLYYPVRPDYPVSWCSHLDVADVAAALLPRSDVTGIVGVGQLPAVTGDDLAEAVATYLERDVTFKRLRPEEFGRLLAPLVGDNAAAEVASAYKAKEQTADAAIDERTSAQKLLGIAPRSITQWLRDIAF